MTALPIGDTEPQFHRAAARRLSALTLELHRLREAQGLAPGDLAARVGCSRRTIENVEAGETTPSLGTVLLLLAGLGRTLMVVEQHLPPP